MSSTGYPCLICYKIEVDAKENTAYQENEAENQNNENDLNNRVRVSNDNSAAAVLTTAISPSTRPSTCYSTQSDIDSDECIFETFCLSFGIQLPLRPANIEVEWNNGEENDRKFPFCVSCRPVAQNLCELNQRFTSIKIEIEQAKLRIRSSILSSINHDKKKLLRSRYRHSHCQTNHSNNSDSSAVKGNKSEDDDINFKNHFVGPKCKMKKKEMEEFQKSQVRIIRDLIVGPTLRLSKCDNLLSGPTSFNTEHKKSNYLPPLEFTYAPVTGTNSDNAQLQLARPTGNKILDLIENTTTIGFDVGNDIANNATVTAEMVTANPEDQMAVAHKNQDVIDKEYQVKVETMEELIKENNDNDDYNDDIGVGSCEFEDLSDRAYDDDSSDDQDDDDSNDKDFALPSDSEEELVSFDFDTSSASKQSKVNPSKLHPRPRRRYPLKKAKTKSAGSATISDKPKSLCRKTIKCDGVEDKYIYDGQYEFTGNPTQGFQCSLCPGRKFVNKSKVTCHVRDTHTPKRKRCPICGKCFRMTKLVNQHIRNTHDSDKCVVCEICGKTVNRSTLSTHKKTVHIGERRFICELCGKGFTSSQVLRRHMGSHSTSQPYECELCYTKFKKKGTLTRHLKTFHGYVAGPTSTSGSASVSSTSASPKPKSVVEDLDSSETANEKKGNAPTPAPIPIPFNLVGSEIEACVEEDIGDTDSSSLKLCCRICNLKYNRQNNLTRHLLQIHHINVKGLAWKSRRSIDPHHHSSQSTFPVDSFPGFQPHPSSRHLQTIPLFPPVPPGAENRSFLFPPFNPFSEPKI